MAWKPKNMIEVFFPLDIFNGIFGYGIFQYPIGKPRVLFSRIYSIIFAVLYYFTVFYYFSSTLRKSWTTVEKKVYAIRLVINVLTGLISQLFSCYYATKFLKLLKKLTMVDETLEELGTKPDYEKILKMEYILIFYYGSLGVSCFLFNNFSRPIALSFAGIMLKFLLFHAHHVNHITPLNFSLLVRILESRFRKVNELLIELSSNSIENTKKDENVIFRRFQNLENRLKVKIRNVAEADKYYLGLVQVIRHLHLELTSISNGINDIYGTRMLLNTVFIFSLLVGTSYDFVKKFMLPDEDGQVMRLCCIGSYLVAEILSSIIVNRCCETFRTEAEAAKMIIHDLHSRIEDPEFEDEKNIFVLQLTINPASFSMCESLTLEHSFLITLVDTIVTYIIILVQFDQDIHS